jgi:lipoic acid synthetase
MTQPRNLPHITKEGERGGKEEGKKGQQRAVENRLENLRHGTPEIPISLQLPLINEASDSKGGGCGGSARSGRSEKSKTRKRLPDWFRTNLATGTGLVRFNETRNAVESGHLNTVCQEAQCPNIHDCWSRGTATFMVAGEVCTRGCKFCAVDTKKIPPPLDPDEPKRLAATIEAMQLSYAVITCVNRDDLTDGGAAHYRACLQAIATRSPNVGLEFLCSDLDGNGEALARLLEGLPIEVFAHNVECVPRLDSVVRDSRASFEQSLMILAEAKRLRPDIPTKSSLMVGVGESDEEVVEAMQLLRAADVELLTIGQYLQPSSRHLNIDRFPTPEQFVEWAVVALEMGFKAVASGPLVRSSFRAGQLLKQALEQGAC